VEAEAAPDAHASAAAPVVALVAPAGQQHRDGGHHLAQPSAPQPRARCVARRDGPALDYINLYQLSLKRGNM
jgi:hypothetical protein